MAKIKFNLYSPDLERLGDKYLASVLSNGSLDLSAVAQRISEGRPAIDEAEVTLAVSALASEIARALGNAYKVTTSIGYFTPDISGSLPSMDASTTEENEINVLFVVNPSVTASIAAIKPVNDIASLGTAMDGVEDAATHAVGVINGTGDFILTGKGLSLTQQDESLALVKDDGSVLSAVTYKPDPSYPPIYLRACLVTRVPAGSYRLRLKTRGYNNPTGTVMTLHKKVTVA